MKKKWISIIVIVVLAVAGVSVIKRKQKEIARLPKPSPQPMAVQTAVASKGRLEVLSYQIGEIQPVVSANMAARITGHILSIAKREGDFAEKGEVVCEIDDRELADRAAAVQTDAAAGRQRLAAAQSTYETQSAVTRRDEKLFSAGAISKEALERSRSALDSARASVNAFEETIKGIEKNASAARLQTGYAKIRAPFSGVVTRRLAEPGDLAVPGKPILVLEQRSPVKVTAQVSQELVQKLTPGVKVYVTDGTQRMVSTITKVYPTLGKNFMGSIEIVLERSPFGLPTGSTIGVDLVTAQADGIIVPVNALSHTDRGYFVHVVENQGLIRIRRVEFLGAGSGMAAVRGDLTRGSIVAVAQENKLLTLTDGIKVSIKEKP